MYNAKTMTWVRRVASAGPAERRGTLGIRPNHLFGTILTLFQPEADCAHHILMSQPTFSPFNRAWSG